MKITAITCVKNEGPFLLEWVAFNRVIGVTDFLIYSNDCDDGTAELLDALATAGLVVHLPNPAKGRKYQVEALRDARRQNIAKDADWVWIADVDEFLNIHAGDGQISDLIAACDDPQAISVSHQHFSNCGIEGFADEPVIAQFDRSHNPDIWCDRLEIEVKTLFRPDLPSNYWGAHRPFLSEHAALRPRLLRWSDGSGRRVPRGFLLNLGEKRRFGFRAQGARRHATLNHYPLRSVDSYLVKADRGDVNRDFRAFDDTYWCERNDDGYGDRSIQKYLPRLRAEMKRLRALPQIGKLHEVCVQRHGDKLAQLIANPEFARLRKQLVDAPRLPPAELALIKQLDRGFAPVSGAPAI